MILVPADPNQVTVVLPADLKAVLEQRAAKKKQTVEDYVTHALTMYLK